MMTSDVPRPPSSDSRLDSWRQLNRQIVACRNCPRLIRHCQQIGKTRRKAFRDWEYWAQPVPNFGEPCAALLVVGLAPAAHGANRTGRMFTGDQSGVWLYRALHRAGWATQPDSLDRNDGMRLVSCAITAVCHCAPPQNRPSPHELKNCQGWLDETVSLVCHKVILALGQIAWNAVIRVAQERKWLTGKRPPFGHGQVVLLGGSVHLLGSYHPSQQNTFTGRLTEAMLDEIMLQARRLARAALPRVDRRVR